MFDRKVVVAAVAAMGLGFGTVCTMAQSQNQQVDQKNPALALEKDKTSDADLHQKMEEQEKMKSDLMANFNDADFVKVASMANCDEIKAAETAKDKSKNDDVIAFAQHMIDDHTKAGTELKSLANSKGWTIGDQCDVKHSLDMKEMDKLTGADFDKAYATSAVADHEGAVALFKTASEKASDPDLKAFASKMLPNFKAHLNMAQDLEAKTAAVTVVK